MLVVLRILISVSSLLVLADKNPVEGGDIKNDSILIKKDERLSNSKDVIQQNLFRNDDDVDNDTRIVY